MDTYVSKWIPAAQKEAVKTPHLGGLVVTVEESEHDVDGEALAANIQRQCNDLAMDGYDVISILPVDRGKTIELGGHSVTDGVIITARKDG